MTDDNESIDNKDEECHKNDDDDNNKEEMEADPVRNSKRQQGTMEEEGGTMGLGMSVYGWTKKVSQK
jgi:hypothetical protein